jgi:hypothetical protein
MRPHLILALTLLALGCAAEPVPSFGTHVEILREPTLQPWARFPERHPGFRSVEVTPSTLVFTFDGASPLEVGTVVAGDARATDTPYARHIDHLEPLPDGRIRATTTPAGLTDLVRDLHVISHFRPGEDHLPSSDDVSGRRSALDTDLLVRGCTVGAGHIQPHIDVTNTFVDFDLDISSARVESATFTITGSITAGYDIESGGTATGSCTVGGDVGRIVLGAIPVGPIVLTLYASPTLGGTARLDLDAGDLHARARATIGADVELGYLDGEWDAHYTPHLTGTAEITTTRPGHILAEARLRIGARLGVALYDTAGIWVDLTGNLQAEHATDVGTCTFTNRLTASATATFGGEIRIPILGTTLASVTASELAGPQADLWLDEGTLPWCDPLAP